MSELVRELLLCVHLKCGLQPEHHKVSGHHYILLRNILISLAREELRVLLAAEVLSREVCWAEHPLTSTSYSDRPWLVKPEQDQISQEQKSKTQVSPMSRLFPILCATPPCA